SAFTLVDKLPSDGNGWQTLPVPIFTNWTECDGKTEEELNQSVQQAIALWESVPTSRLKLEIKGTTSTETSEILNGTFPDPGIVIFCETDFETEVGGDEDSIPGGTAVAVEDK